MSRPFQASRPCAPTCTTLGMDLRIADGTGVDDAGSGAAGEPPRKAWLATAELDRRLSGARVHLTAASASLATANSLPAVRRVAVFLKALGLGHHHVDRAEIAGLRPGRRRSQSTETPIAPRRATLICASTPRQRGFELRRGRQRCAAGRRAPRPRLRRCCSSWRGAMRELVQLQRGAAARIGQDLARPSANARLAVEGGTPDAPTGWRSARGRRRRAGRACGPCRTAASTNARPAVLQPLGQRRPGLRQHAADARGMALQRQLLEPVELFPGQAQHARPSACSAPSAAGRRWRARLSPSHSQVQASGAGNDDRLAERRRPRRAGRRASVGRIALQHLRVVPAPAAAIAVGQ